MKRLLLASILAIGPLTPLYARDIYKSSQTATSDLNKPLCTGTQRGFFRGVCVNQALPPTLLSIYNSTFTPTVAGRYDMDVTTETCRYYDAIMPNGIMYSSTGTSKISILYDCF